MIKFSWKKINDKLDWKAFDVMNYFFLKHNHKCPYSDWKIKSKVKKEVEKPYPKGPCFLINSDPLFTNKHSLNDIYLYIELASKRNLFDYQMRGVKSLPLILVPEYLKGIIETNPLITVKNGNIYFKYEQEKQ